MLRLPPADPLRPGEAFALDVLVDLARVAPVAGDGVAVSLQVMETPDADLCHWRARGFGFEIGDGEVRVPRPVLASVLAVAGAHVEQGSSARDRYGRVPSSENPLVARGLEREPIVSEVATVLGRAVRLAAGSRPVALLAPWPDGKRWAVAMTHDLDVVDRWPAFTLLRMAELVRRGRVELALRVAGAALGAATGDPVWGGVDGILRVEQRLGLRSTWFVLCGTPTLATMRAGDLTYVPEGRRPRRILAAVTAAGHEIGLHGSFDTYADAGKFAEQRARLASLAEGPLTGVRQHYMRMSPGSTQAAMAVAGFAYDATYGFPDRNGFRLGAADILPGWGRNRNAPNGLDEVPLIWMDRALSKYQGIEDPRAWVADALELADRCRTANGLWVGLWHPNLTSPLGFPGAPAAFAALLEAVLRHDPWVAPLRELVAWRRARRAARVRGVLPDGRLVLDAEPGVALEDADGRPLPSVRP